MRLLKFLIRFAIFSLALIPVSVLAQKDFLTKNVRNDTCNLFVDPIDFTEPVQTQEMQWDSLDGCSHIQFVIVGTKDSLLNQCEVTFTPSLTFRLVELISDRPGTPVESKENKKIVSYQKLFFMLFQKSEDADQGSFYFSTKIYARNQFESTREFTLRILPEERISALTTKFKSFYWLELAYGDIQEHVKVKEILYRDLAYYDCLKFEVFNTEARRKKNQTSYCQIEFPADDFYRRAYIEPAFLGKNITANQRSFQVEFKKWFSILIEPKPMGEPQLPCEFALTFYDNPQRQNLSRYLVRITNQISEFIPVTSIQVSPSELDFGTINDAVKPAIISIEWQPPQAIALEQLRCELQSADDLIQIRALNDAHFQKYNWVTLTSDKNTQQFEVTLHRNVRENRRVTSGQIELTFRIFQSNVRFTNDLQEFSIPLTVKWNWAPSPNYGRIALIVFILFILISLIYFIVQRKSKSNTTAKTREINLLPVENGAWSGVSQKPTEARVKSDLPPMQTELPGVDGKPKIPEHHTLNHVPTEIEISPAPQTEKQLILQNPFEETATVDLLKKELAEKDFLLRQRETELKQLTHDLAESQQELQQEQTKAKKVQNAASELPQLQQKLAQEQAKNQAKIEKLLAEVNQLRGQNTKLAEAGKEVPGLKARLEQLQQSLKEIEEKDRRQQEQWEGERSDFQQQLARLTREQDAANQNDGVLSQLGLKSPHAIKLLGLLVTLSDLLNHSQIESDAGSSIRLMTQRLAGMLQKLARNDGNSNLALEEFEKLKSNHLQRLVDYLKTFGNNYREELQKLKKFS